MTRCEHRDDPDPRGRPVLALQPEALFVTAVLRSWVAAHRPGPAEAPDWRDICARAELPHWATQAFGAFMGAVHLAMQRPLDIRCCRCPQLGRDEDIMLGLLHALQCDDRLGAIDALSGWLAPESVMPVFTLASDLAARFEACGIHVGGGPVPEPDGGEAGPATIGPAIRH